MLVMAAVHAAGAYAQSLTQTPDVDTVLNMPSPSRIVITENSGGSVISVTGMQGNDTVRAEVRTDYPADASVSAKQSSALAGGRLEIPGFPGGGNNSGSGWKCYVDGVYIGLGKALGQGHGDGLQWSKSFEIGWLECIAAGYSWGRTAVSLGLGFDWRNYKITTSDRYLAPTPSKGLEWVSADMLPEGSRLRNSRLKVFSLQLPLLFRASIPGSCLRVKVGPVYNFNTYASVLTIFDDNGGNRNELFTTGVRPRRFTADIFGSISISGALGVYVRYSPMKVMDAADGINFRPLTVGFTLGI